MKLGTGIGIAALVFAIISIFIPMAGIVLGGIALLITCVAALFGDKGLTIATVVISIVNYFFLTPSLRISDAGHNLVQTGGNNTGLWILIYVLLAAPIVCMFLYSGAKVRLGKS